MKEKANKPNIEHAVATSYIRLIAHAINNSMTIV